MNELKKFFKLGQHIMLALGFTICGYGLFEEGFGSISELKELKPCVH